MVEPIVLTLQRAIDLALEHNRGVLQSRNNLRASEFTLASERSNFDLKFIPSASFSQEADASGYNVALAVKKQLSFGPSLSVGPEVVKRESDYENGVTASLQIPLLKGAGRTVVMDGVYAAEYLLRSSRRTHYERLVQTVLDTTTQFYEVKKQEGLRELSAGLVARLQGHASSARARAKVDLASPLDVYRAEIQQNNAQGNLVRDREAFTAASNRLKELLALPYESELVIDTSIIPDRIAMGETEAIDIALKNRVDLLQALDEADEAIRHSRVSRRNILPQVDLVSSYRQHSADPSFAENSGQDRDSWSVMVQGSTDLGRRSERLDYKSALVDAHTKKIAVEESRQKIVSETLTQLRKLIKASEEMVLREQTAHQAQGKLLLSLAKFNHGMATNFDLIEAEIELSQARGGQIQASVDYIVGVFALRAALGTLLSHQDFGL